MARLLFALVALFVATGARGQSVRVRVLDAHERAPLPGATVALVGTPRGATTDARGEAVLEALTGASVELDVSHPGYRSVRLTVALPRPDTAAVLVELDEAEESLDELVVSTTRAGRTIADTPTRIEAIDEEELGEKLNMDPSGIAMLLNESPGIAVQQTDPVGGAAGFRIQGLDSRYTLLLRDGYPLYGGLSGGLSLLQTPPLDLAGVEIIKGPASTLYGGDAIAGIVNLLPRRPTMEGERTLLVNGTTAGGLDVAGFTARRGARWGHTVLVSGHLQRAYDAEADGFSNLPAARRLTVAPTWFGYGTGTWEAGLSATADVREGGDVAAVRDEAAGYSERTASARLSGHAGYERPVGTALLRLRTSASAFDRTIDRPALRFSGRQWTTYSEASTRAQRGAHAPVLGLDLRTESFSEDPGTFDRSYRQGALGAFVQDTWDVGPGVVLETGLRLDRHLRRAGDDAADAWFLLPRAAVMLRPAAGTTVRASGGLGYKAPTLFIEAAERRAFARVLRPGADVRPERSAGAGLDVNLRRTWLDDRLGVSFNQAVFYNHLRHALRLGPDTGDGLRLRNADGPTRTWGSETTARIGLEPLALFLGYVFTNAHEEANGQRVPVAFTARHRTYTVLVWEAHGRFRLGLEAYYTGPQTLAAQERAPGFLVAGVMGERTVGRARLFVNLENLLDARQSRTAPLVSGPRATPAFAEIWGPVDGFIANAGVRLAL